MKRVCMSFLFILLLPSAVAAVSVQSGQEFMILTVEDGGSVETMLIVNSPNGETLASSGAASPWIRFNGQANYTLQQGTTIFVKLNISVPENQSPGSYSATLLADGATLSTLSVIVTLPAGEIASLQTLADVNQKISALQISMEASVRTILQQSLTDIQTQISSIKTNLSGSIQRIHDYKADIAALEAENANLKETNANLTNIISSLSADMTQLKNTTTSLENEKQHLVLTGSIVRTESYILFFLGVLLGAGGIYLFYKKLQRYV